MITLVYVGIGANLNNPKRQVKKAMKALATLPQTKFITQSSLYLSPPMGPQDQDHYINAIAKLETDLKAIDLLDQLQAIENSQGRVRKSERWGPRTLDLDLILYGNQIINEERLTIPHYGLKQRAFVLVPLEEVDPHLILPDNSKIFELVQQLGKQGIQKL